MLFPEFIENNPIIFDTPVQAAMYYVDQGYMIFPVWWNQNGFCACAKKDRCERPAKHPITKHGFKDATLDKRKIAAWWYEYPDANIGIRTGPESGIVVIDLDVGEDKDGLAGFRQIYDELHGESVFPATRFQETGSGGLHLIFRYPQNRVVNNLSTGLLVKGTLYSGIDVRGKDGYIIAAPSRNMKGEYRMYDLHIEELPDWLMQIICEDGSANNTNRENMVEVKYEKTYELISSYWPNDGRHNFTLALASRMLWVGVPMRVAEQVILRANESITIDGKSPHSTHDLLACVRDAYATGTTCSFAALKNAGFLDGLNSISSGLWHIWKRRDPLREMAECKKSHDAISIEYKTFWQDENMFFEQIRNGFVAWDLSTNQWEVLDHVHTHIYVENQAYRPGRDGKGNGEPRNLEVVYYPLINQTVNSGQITLPDRPVEYNELKGLVKKTEELCKKWIYISPEELSIFNLQIRIAIASWFLYVFDDAEIPERIAGLLAIIGVSGGGKKRFLTILRMISYRPVYTLSSTRIPSTYRLVEPWGNATLLVDEADQKESGSESEWIQFFNARYDGTPISRYNALRGENEIFRSFGLTGFALRRSPIDEGVISRMTRLNATMSPIELPELAGPEIFEDFREIRNKLLYLRLKYYGKLKFVGRSKLPAEHSWRGKEMLTLLRTLAQIDSSMDEDILELSKQLTEREVINLSSSWDGVILNEIFAFITSEECQFEFKRNSVFFYKTTNEDKVDKKVTPLTLSHVSKRLATTASDVKRSIAQFKIDVLTKGRINSKEFRGILLFGHISDTDRIFTRYIPDYAHELAKLVGQTKLE